MVHSLYATAPKIQFTDVGDVDNDIFTYTTCLVGLGTGLPQPVYQRDIIIRYFYLDFFRFAKNYRGDIKQVSSRRDSA